MLLIVRFVKTWDQTIIQIIKKNKSILMSLTRKTTSFKSLRVDNWEITQVKSKYQINFSVKLAKKGVTQKKWISSSNFTFKIVQPSNFNLNWQSLNFWTKLSQKSFQSEKEINENYHRILHIRISRDSKFQLRETFLIFLNEFPIKEYFRSKTENMNITTEFFIFKLV